VFELLVAPAVLKTVGPVIDANVGVGRILDVGCGGGLIAGSLRSSTGRTVIGIDASRSQVRRFNKRSGDGGPRRAYRARAEALPFPDDSFDALYSSCAWKHWPDPTHALAECARVVRPGGTMVIVEINRLSSLEEWRRFAASGPIPRFIGRLVSWFTMKSVVPAAPDANELVASVDVGALHVTEVTTIQHLPFLCLVGAVK
jgi:ubiquinone/menaquinone biosynthesis C-methylase UbiE